MAQLFENRESRTAFKRIQSSNNRSQRIKKNYGRHPHYLLIIFLMVWYYYRKLLYLKEFLARNGPNNRACFPKNPIYQSKKGANKE
jgi:hypothetical protein